MSVTATDGPPHVFGDSLPNFPGISDMSIMLFQIFRTPGISAPEQIVIETQG
jgi:hypothetical protein